MTKQKYENCKTIRVTFSNVGTVDLHKLKNLPFVTKVEVLDNPNDWAMKADILETINRIIR